MCVFENLLCEICFWFLSLYDNHMTDTAVSEHSRSLCAWGLCVLPIKLKTTTKI